MKKDKNQKVIFFPGCRMQRALQRKRQVLQRREMKKDKNQKVIFFPGCRMQRACSELAESLQRACRELAESLQRACRVKIPSKPQACQAAAMQSALGGFGAHCRLGTACTKALAVHPPWRAEFHDAGCQSQDNTLRTPQAPLRRLGHICNTGSDSPRAWPLAEAMPNEGADLWSLKRVLRSITRFVAYRGSTTGEDKP